MTLAFSIKPEISLGAGQAYLKKQMLINRDFFFIYILTDIRMDVKNSTSSLLTYPRFYALVFILRNILCQQRV